MLTTQVFLLSIVKANNCEQTRRPLGGRREVATIEEIAHVHTTPAIHNTTVLFHTHTEYRCHSKTSDVAERLGALGHSDTRAIFQHTMQFSQSLVNVSSENSACNIHVQPR